MHVSTPREGFPEIGTAENPAVFYDGDDAYVCYEASFRAGGGNVVLKFASVIDFRITPTTVEGLRDCRYPVRPWVINEVVGAEETAAWKVLNPRLWLISFTDITIEVLFEAVSLVSHDSAERPPNRTLIDVLR